MQKAIELSYNGMTLRGMEHVPERADAERVPAVILFHGFTGTKLEPHRFFWKLSRALEQAGIAAFRFDFLGSGESDGNFEDMTPSKEIAEAGAILDFVKRDPRIDPERVSLLGLSMGGLVASVVAGERSAEVERLMLLAPAGEIHRLIETIAGDWLADRTCNVFDLEGNLVGRAFADDAYTLNVLERAAGYDGEVLLIHGTQDVTVPYQMSHLYQQKCYGDRATLHLVEGAGHTFNKFEWEQDVIQTVLAFVTKERA